MQMREKVAKLRNTVFFQWFEAPDGRKVGSLKAAGAEPAGQMRRWKIARRCGAKHISKSKCTKHLSLGPLLEVETSKKSTPLWREAHFEVKMYKTHQVRTTFGSWDVEKVHAVVARSTFRSQKCKKHQKTKGHGALLEVEMLKSATPLWREAHFEVKMYKAHHVRTTFGRSDVEKVHAVVGRSTFRSQNVKSTRGSDHFWRFRCRFASLRFTLHYTPPHCTTLHYYITLHYTPQHYSYNYTTTPLHSTTLNYTTLRYTTLHYTPLHYTSLHYTTLPFTTLHYITLHSTTLQLQLIHNYTPLHSTTLHYIPLHYTTLHYTTRHYTTLHYTTLPSTTLHYITLHYIPLHYTNYNYTTTLHYTPLHSTTLHYTPLH